MRTPSKRPITVAKPIAIVDSKMCSPMRPRKKSKRLKYSFVIKKNTMIILQIDEVEMNINFILSLLSNDIK